MAKLVISRSVLDAARQRCSLTNDEQEQIESLLGVSTGNVNMTIELSQFPRSLACSLLESSTLKPNQRAILALHVHGIQAGGIDHEDVYSLRVSSPVEFGSAFGTLGQRNPNAELSWNGRWYPVILSVVFQEDDQRLAKLVSLKAILGLATTVPEFSWPVESGLFLNEDGDPSESTVLEVLEKLGFRRMQISPSEFNLRLVRAERLSTEAGQQIWLRGPVLELTSQFWFGSGLGMRPLGTVEVPRRAVIDSEIGSSDRDYRYGFGARRYSESVSRMPFVRAFSLDTKSFVFADIDDVELYEYDDSALSRICLPDRMKGVLQKVFETPTDQLFGDLIRGKHGGVVILASGKPGVGKTLTAEVYAEMTHRPLYVLEFGELGTTVETIEHNLQSVFARVVRWKAVLQFDECEIFLSHRGGDLERSAIVGIFLRLLDYYEGLLFLTTNRPETLDYAIRSRVMLRLEYPDLDANARATIWRTMFTAAGLELVQGTFEELADYDVNGRQIRNLVRLIRILKPDRVVTLEEMREALAFGCR